MKLHPILLAAGLAALATTETAAQPTITWGGLVHTRYTLGQDVTPTGADADQRLGFGVRRARIRMTTTVMPGTRVFFQLEGSGIGETLIDARLDHDLSEKATLRMGRFLGAQPRAFGGTLVHELDVTDRAAIAEQWASTTRGADGRSYGLEYQYQLADHTLQVFAHSGNGSAARNYRAGISDGSETSGVDNLGQALALAWKWTPGNMTGWEFGAYSGYDATRFNGTPFFDQAVHAYYGALPGSQPFRIKFDYIGIRYVDDRALAGGPTGTINGISLMGAFLVRDDLELFGRLERQDANATQTYLAAGGSWSFSERLGIQAPFHHNRISLAWSYQGDSRSGIEPGHLVTAQVQVYF